jgi:hypothetical protein
VKESYERVHAQDKLPVSLCYRSSTSYDSAVDPKALSEYSLFQRPPHLRGQNRKDNALPYQPRSRRKRASVTIQVTPFVIYFFAGTPGMLTGRW